MIPINVEYTKVTYKYEFNEIMSFRVVYSILVYSSVLQVQVGCNWPIFEMAMFSLSKCLCWMLFKLSMVGKRLYLTRSLEVKHLKDLKNFLKNFFEI